MRRILWLGPVPGREISGQYEAAPQSYTNRSSFHLPNLPNSMAIILMPESKKFRHIPLESILGKKGENAATKVMASSPLKETPIH